MIYCMATTKHWGRQGIVCKFPMEKGAEWCSPALELLGIWVHLAKNGAFPNSGLNHQSRKRH